MPARRGPFGTITARSATRRTATSNDAGSVLPLVVGMVTGILLLGAGVTAATSVFLARANLQHLCDGAASAAAESVQRAGSLAPSDGFDAVAADAAERYVAPRAPGTRLEAAVDGEWTQVACSTRTAVAFGGLFGSPSVDISVGSAGRAHLATGDS